MAKYKVYLAGPVSNCNQKQRNEWRKKVKSELAKLGLTCEGTCRSGLFHRDRFWDLHLFSVLRGEWRGQPGPGVC